MKKNTYFLFVLLFSATAHAGPPVQVTFKNGNSTEDAIAVVEDKNELLSFADASPKPKANVKAGATDTFTVQNTMIASMNMAHVHYKMGNKHCVFRTVYQKNSSGIPNWTKSDKPSGGAFCDSKITSANPTTHAWSIEMTMK